MLRYGMKVMAKDLITIRNGDNEYVEILKGTKVKCVGDEDAKTGLVLVTTGEVLACVKSHRFYELRK